MSLGIPDARLVRPAGRGMTLTELLVSMAILSLMILVVGSIVVRTRKVVETAEDAIRANTDIRAIANRLHEDLAGTTKEGFLAVAYDAGGLPHLVVANVSTFRSVMLGLPGNFARIDYGLSPQPPLPAPPQGVLWRRAYLHYPVWPVAGYDLIQGTLADYRLPEPTTRSPRATIRTILTAPGGSLTPPPIPALPPATLQEGLDLWPYMSGGVGQARLQWTDGSEDAQGRMRWYDKDSPKDSQWATRDAAFQDAAANMNSDSPEYNLGGASANPALYCALWTFRKKDNWPKAVRIQVWVGASRRFYEVDLGLPE